MSHSFNYLRCVTGHQASIPIVSEKGEWHLPKITQSVSLCC